MASMAAMGEMAEMAKMAKMTKIAEKAKMAKIGLGRANSDHLLILFKKQGLREGGLLNLLVL